jgi:DNA-binding XRE family transcriptional regulator
MKMHEAAIKKEEFIIARAYEGKSFDTISNELDVSKNTLLKWERENHEIIRAFSKVKAGLIAEDLKVKMEHRIERLGTIQDMLFCEIENRKLSVIPAHKIIELFLTVQKSLREELTTLKLEKFETSEFLETPLFNL